MKTYSILRYAALAFLALTLSACAGDKDKDEEKLPPDEPVDMLYNKAADLMDKATIPKPPSNSLKSSASIHIRHGRHGAVMEAYADYQALDYDAAIKSVDAFIELHPGSPDRLCLLLAALCNYERIADVRRDQGYATTR